VGSPDRPPPRERILDAADCLFYARGIHAVGVDAIIARADTAKTTLYGHFGSKDQLVAAYLRRRAAAAREVVETELGSYDGSAVDRILRVYALLGRALADPGFRGCPFTNACAEFDDDHPAATVAREHRRWLRDTFAQLGGEAGAPAPRRLAAQLLMLYDGAMVRAHVDRDDGAAASARAAAAALLRAEIGRADPTAGAASVTAGDRRPARDGDGRAGPPTA
jgi:AcrR family transcriptional regulator